MLTRAVDSPRVRKKREKCRKSSFVSVPAELFGVSCCQDLGQVLKKFDTPETSIASFCLNLLNYVKWNYFNCSKKKRIYWLQKKCARLSNNF